MLDSRESYHKSGRENKKLCTTAENLAAVILKAINLGEADESQPMTDHLRIASRICAARGAEVPLFRIQHDPVGKGFMADPRIRISELNREWGLDIRQRFDRGEQERSVRWIEMAADGLPTINLSRPKAPALRTALDAIKPKLKAGWQSQGFSFGKTPVFTTPKPAQPAQESFSQSLLWETGRAR